MTTSTRRHLSTGNSTTTPLGSAGVFIGEKEGEAYIYGWATVTVTTDVPGNLYIEYGPDGTNWYSQAYPINQAPFEPRFQFTLAISGSFARTRFVNGPTAQGSLLIETIYHSDTPNPASNRFDHPVFGVFLQTSTVRGRADLLAGDSQAIWGFADIEPDWTKSGTVSIVSTSTQDSPSGTGMGSVAVFGTDPSTGNFLFEVVALNGTVAATSSGNYNNPLIGLVGTSAGSGGSDFPNPLQSVADGIITATIDGAQSAIIDPAKKDNAAQTVNVRLAKTSLGLETVAVVNEVTISVGKIGTPATGTVAVEFWRKSIGPPAGLWDRFAPTEIKLTASPSITQLLVNLLFKPGDLLMCTAAADKDVSVGVSALARIFMPLATCTGDCT